jgi:hypothetical protein
MTSTRDDRYSIVDALHFEQVVPRGIDVARAPGHLWLLGEVDADESHANFMRRVRREAREAGLSWIEVSGFFQLPTDD